MLATKNIFPWTRSTTKYIIRVETQTMKRIMENHDLTIPIEQISNHEMPWQKVDRTSKVSPYTAKRTEYFLSIAGQKGIDFVFKYKEDPLTQNLIWNVSSMAVDRDNPQREDFQSPEIFNMTLPDLASKVKKQRNELGLPENEDIKLIEARPLPETDPKYYDFLDGVISASLYNDKGELKNFNDGEGYMLLFTHLTFKGLNDTLSNQALDNLKHRTKFLRLEKQDDSNKIQDILENKPSWGEIPFEKIRMVHVNDFGPAVNGDQASIIPQCDVSDFPRRSIHTFLNGMVEEHGTDLTGTNTWEERKFAMVTNFKDTILENGLPDNTLSADTYWKTRPGEGLKLPKNTILFLPSNISPEQYQKAGLNCIQYDSENTTLRETIKEYFLENEIPFLDNITDKEGLSDYYPKFDIPVRNYPYHSGPDGSTEDVLRNCRYALKQGEEISKSVMSNPQENNTNLSYEEIGSIAVFSSHTVQVTRENKRLQAHCAARANVMDAIEDYVEKHQEIGFLEMLFKAGLI